MGTCVFSGVNWANLTLLAPNSLPGSSHFLALNTLPTSPCHPWPCVHSTEVRLHRVSVHRCPQLLIPLMIFMNLKGRGRSDMPNLDFPDNSSSNHRRENFSLSLTHAAPVIWVSSGGVGCQLSTRDVSGRLPTSKPGAPYLKGDVPLLITPMLV